MKRLKQIQKGYLIKILYALILLLPTTAHRADIHKCLTEHGYVYSDIHCTGGILIMKSPTGAFRNNSQVEGLSELELRDLEELDRQYQKSRKHKQDSQTARRNKNKREKARQTQDRARVCALAKNELRKVRSSKRKGYGVSQTRSLDEREEKYGILKQRNC